MSRLYHTLVVVGGALVGCGGASSDDSPNAKSAGAEGTQASPSDAVQGDAPGEATVGGGDDAQAGMDDPSMEPPSTDDPTMADPTMGDATTENPSESGEGEDIVDDPDVPPDAQGDPTPDTPPTTPDPAQVAVGQAPDGCSSEQWRCGVAECDRNVNCFEPTGDSSNPPCPTPIANGCECDSSAPSTALACDDGQVFTCLYGTFEQPDGTVESLPYDCRCLDSDPESSQVGCDEHPNTSENRQRSEPGATELWCGNCAVPLIR